MKFTPANCATLTQHHNMYKAIDCRELYRVTNNFGED